MANLLQVGTWVVVRPEVTDYAGQVGVIDWIHQDPEDTTPYGVDLVDLGDSLFFSADELIVLPGQPEDESRQTHLVMVNGTEYLLVTTSDAELDRQEQELIGWGRQYVA